MDVQLFLLWWLSLMPSMGQLMCHPANWRVAYPTVFQPGPQFCPGTGKTVCAAVDYYPTDRIYNLLTSARSQVFNLTSLFVDERKGDTEPNTSQLITHPPYYQNRDRYGPNQPPPSGRFSPAGRAGRNQASRNRWSESPSYWTSSNRWRQVPATTRTPSYGAYRSNTESGNAFLDQYNGRDRSTQGHRTDERWQSNNNGEPQYHQEHRTNGNRDIAGGYERPPHHPHQRTDGHQNNYGPDPVRNPDGSMYKQPNYDQEQLYLNHDAKIAQNNNKGQPLYMNTKQRELTEYDYSWNREPKDQPSFSQNDYIENSDLRTAEPKYQNSVKRGKRNQDVEVACPVQSTFVPPRAALNDQSQWKYIVNVPERDQRFSQVVRVDVCMTEGQACSSRLSLPFGFESRCRQKYIKKKLLSLNPDGQGTGEDNFFIPSCCVCEIVRIGSK